MTTFRKGDRVSIVGTIKHDQDEDLEKNIFIEVDGYHSDIWVSPTLVKLVQPHFEVGDECSWPLGVDPDGEVRATGEILAINNGHAWISRDGGDYCTRLLTSIKRIDSRPEDSDD